VESPGPSLAGLSRAHWGQMLVSADPDGTQHTSRYSTGSPRYTDGLPRQRGEHPTPESAIDTSAQLGVQTKAALAAPFHGALDVILFIPRLFVFAPGEVVASPAIGYERYQQPMLDHDVNLAPELAPDVAPITPGAAGDEEESREDPQ